MSPTQSTPIDRTAPASRWPTQPIVASPFLDVSGLTDPGRDRTVNTDFFVTADLIRSMVIGASATPFAPGTPWARRAQGKVLIVADGMTGPGMGDVASWAAVETLASDMTCHMPWFIDDDSGTAERAIMEHITDAVRHCQDRVRRAAAEHGHADNPVGTTLTMAYIAWPTVDIVHAGDSRAYLMRRSRLYQLTSDDTLAQQMVDHQVMPPERVSRTPLRNILTNAVGGDDDEVQIEHHRFRLEAGDQLLLCTDGLTQELSTDDISKHLSVGATAASCCRRLVDAANAAGGRDNITAVVARVEAQV